VNNCGGNAFLILLPLYSIPEDELLEKKLD
jgi:hypothetical protein